MFNKLFARPLTLTIAGRELSFNTLAEFEFALAGRTEVPARKITELLELSTRELKREAKSIKAVERQFVEILSRSIERQDGLGSHLRKLDPHLFSQDHDWREIMAALRAKDDKDDDYDELRRIALVKYMQYLAARQEVIKHTYAVKKLKAAREETGAEPPPEPESGAGAMRETVILDSVVLEPEPGRKERFERLPKGEPVVLSLPPESSLDLLLSKHAFKLTATNNSLELVDDEGARHRLQNGKNIIGRDTVCNVTVSAGYRDISRLHLIVEPLAEHRVRLTDLSAHGTFLPAERLAERVT